MAESTTPQGYKKKPLWVYGAAGFLIVVPFANFLISISRQGEPLWYSPKIWALYAGYVPVATWGFVALTFLSGVFLLLVRQVTWLLALVTLVVLAAYNLLVFKQFTVLAIILVAMILFRPFRRPYLDPKTRWWEHHPRYQTNIFGTVLPSEVKVRLHNISLSGIFVEWTDTNHPAPTTGQQINISLGPSLEILCEVVRKHENFLGIRFKHLPRSTKKILKEKIKEVAAQELKAGVQNPRN